ncbi:MAG TPA: hypothetical protein VMW40_07960 [Candidatus Bathyarchaeia archaeon]|nr:hypothetical protein [Candidatus Bathyarchaeia archaeon]
MKETDPSHQIAKIKTEWDKAFKMMLRYYETEVFKSFRIEYDPSTWYQFKNPALIYHTQKNE